MVNGQPAGEQEVKHEKMEGCFGGDDRDIPEEESIIPELLKEEGSLGLSEILEFTGLEPAKLPVQLLRLELAGKIKRAGDGKYSLR